MTGLAITIIILVVIIASIVLVPWMIAWHKEKREIAATVEETDKVIAAKRKEGGDQ